MGYIYILISYMIHFVGWLLGFKIKKKETRNKNEMLFFCLKKWKCKTANIIFDSTLVAWRPGLEKNRERERERERTAWFTEGGRERERARQADGEDRKIEILWEEKGEGVIRKGACVYCVYT